VNTSHKILFIESGTSGGGSFESLYQHLQVINKNNLRPVVVYLNDNRFVEKVKSLSIPVYILTDYIYSNHAPRYIRELLRQIAFQIEKYAPVCYLEFAKIAHAPLVRELERLIKKEHVDIIHLNDQPNRDLFGIFAAEKTKVICISHLRSMRSLGFESRRADYANKIVSLYLANSKATKEYWEEKGIDPSKTRVLYNYISNTPIKSIDIRQALDIKAHANPILGCVSNLHTGKGHSFLLKAFNKFVKSHCDAVLLLVGDGPLKEKLVKQARELELQDSVLFVGYKKQVLDIISGLDLLVVPSRSEGFGRVILEAMQVQTPVVATRCGGIPEIVEHEFNGLLVEYGNEKELSKAMIRLIEEEHLRLKVIENAYQTISEQFDVEHYKSELKTIYGSLIDIT